MRKDFGPKTWLYPMPVLMVGTYDENGKANLMNAAWGGIYNTNQIVICLDVSHKTTDNIKLTKAFTVSVGNVKNVVACDYCGLVSGKTDPNKMEKSGFTWTKSEKVNAPLFTELPFTLECKLVKIIDECIVGEIVNVSADESILDEKGNVDVNKLEPITYDSINHDYIKLGEKIGKAFQDGLKLK